MKKGLKLLGELTFDGKKYSNLDIKGLIPMEELEIEDGFYGGRANAIGKTTKNYLYLVLEDLEPIDLILDESAYNKSNEKEKAVTSESDKQKVTEEKEKSTTTKKTNTDKEKAN